MIAGIFHEGSGLGDQLFRYITVRTLAEEKGFEWGMENKGNFKGADFMEPSLSSFGSGAYNYEWATAAKFTEKDVRDSNGLDIRSYDPEINFVKDNTVIDGSFEDSKYWGHNLDNISKWLKVEPLKFWNNECVIGFRGGEYATVPDLFLTKSYYDKAIALMRSKGITKFEVHTDDVALAQTYFPDFKCVHDIGINWRSHRFAQHAIIPNSAFYILPRLLQHTENPNAITIAPRYWARHNTKTWARPACFYKSFHYIHGEDTD
jgi:hypothetical protein